MTKKGAFTSAFFITRFQRAHNKKITTTSEAVMPLHNLTRFPRLGLSARQRRSNICRAFLIILDGKFLSNGMTSLPWQWAAINYVSWRFLAADALREGADTLITAGAIQSNHVRQTAAVAAKLGLHCGAAGKSNWHNRRKLFNQRQSFVAGSVQCRLKCATH